MRYRHYLLDYLPFSSDAVLPSPISPRFSPRTPSSSNRIALSFAAGVRCGGEQDADGEQAAKAARATDALRPSVCDQNKGRHASHDWPQDQKDPVARTLTTADGNDRAPHFILRVCRAIQRGQTNWMKGNIDAQARMDGTGG